jgi:hypothetical protein
MKPKPQWKPVVTKTAGRYCKGDVFIAGEPGKQAEIHIKPCALAIRGVSGTFPPHSASPPYCGGRHKRIQLGSPPIALTA